MLSCAVIAGRALLLEPSSQLSHPCWEKCLHPQQRGSSDSRHCNLGADGTLPPVLRTVELPAAFSDVQPTYLPKIVVFWAPAAFLLHASNPLSIVLGSHARTSPSPGFALQNGRTALPCLVFCNLLVGFLHNLDVQLMCHLRPCHSFLLDVRLGRSLSGNTLVIFFVIP